VAKFTRASVIVSSIAVGSVLSPAVPIPDLELFAAIAFELRHGSLAVDKSFNLRFTQARDSAKLRDQRFALRRGQAQSFNFKFTPFEFQMEGFSIDHAVQPDLASQKFRALDQLHEVLSRRSGQEVRRLDLR
jgi:hypothetical protein